ncbi:MAG: hypothetical protein EZS28_029114, partial [Streblomastix strix]
NISCDESKSVNSQMSGSGIAEGDDGEHMHKYHERFCIILFTLRLLRIVLETEIQTVLSKAINYIILTSLGLSLGKNSIYLTIAIFIVVSGAFILQVVSAVFNNPKNEINGYLMQGNSVEKLQAFQFHEFLY